MPMTILGHQFISSVYIILLLTISDFEGGILSLSLKTEYFFTDDVALGAGYAIFDPSVRQMGVVFYNSLKYSHEGLMAYHLLKY